MPKSLLVSHCYITNYPKHNNTTHTCYLTVSVKKAYSRDSTCGLDEVSNHVGEIQIARNCGWQFFHFLFSSYWHWKIQKVMKTAKTLRNNAIRQPNTRIWAASPLHYKADRAIVRKTFARFCLRKPGSFRKSFHKLEDWPMGTTLRGVSRPVSLLPHLFTTDPQAPCFQIKK